MMESSRIFIKGLPPNITEEEFKKHFSKNYAITDAKLIAHRRIGYIGYKTPEDASKAVKYFNRSFIRMSKIGVEVARPISDSTLPVSRKAQREQDRENSKLSRKTQSEVVPVPTLNVATKRKHDDVLESDLKLKEFLEVMQPASKSKTWTAQEDAEPPTKVQAIELPEGESDGEYEAVLKKSRKESPLRIVAPTVLAEAAATTASIPVAEDLAPVEPGATDDDWLRSRTNRLLDLVDPDDMGTVPIGATPTAALAPAPDKVIEVTHDTPQHELDTEIVIDEEAPAVEDKLDPTIEAIKATGRLFVRNLPYAASEDELRKHFAAHGALDEVHLPVDAGGKSKGFVLVQYTNPEEAAEAFHNLDGEPFQGRLLHIIPASAKRENKLDEFAIAKLPLKKQKQIKKKAEASSATFNWNSLFMNQDAVNEATAQRLGVSKSEMLDPTSADSGVKQAIAETSAIHETKSFFAKHGVDLDAFKKRERGDTCILVKNFPFGMSLEELRKMFEEFGQVLRVLMPPIGTIAIVEFAQPTHARAAFASLAYRRFKDSILYLEKAPKDLFTTAGIAADVTSDPKSGKEKLSSSDLLSKESASEAIDTSTLFVRNLNFSTTNERLTEVFKSLEGFISARVKTKTDPKKPGQILSMGFGFLEFRSKDQAHAALKAMDGYVLDEHKLLIKASHKGLDAAEERRKEDNAKKQAGKRTKIIVKNLPFQATKKDVRALFSGYGELRSVRVPKKFDHTTRGFAFANFITAREAENALEALKDTHLLGRRLVLEFAAEDAVDAEDEIAKMEEKVGAQVNKVAIHNLTGAGRKKFNIEGDEAAGD